MNPEAETPFFGCDPPAAVQSRTSSVNSSWCSNKLCNLIYSHSASIYFIRRWSGSSSSRIICGIGILAIVYHIRFLLCGSCVCDGINRWRPRFHSFFFSCLVMVNTATWEKPSVLDTFVFFSFFLVFLFCLIFGQVPVQLFASDGYPATARKFGGTDRTGSLHIFTCMLLYTTHCVSSKEFIVLLMKIVNKKLNFFKSLILLKWNRPLKRNEKKKKKKTIKNAIRWRLIEAGGHICAWLISTQSPSKTGDNLQSRVREKYKSDERPKKKKTFDYIQRMGFDGRLYRGHY